MNLRATPASPVRGGRRRHQNCTDVSAFANADPPRVGLHTSYCIDFSRSAVGSQQFATRFMSDSSESLDLRGFARLRCTRKKCGYTVWTRSSRLPVSNSERFLHSGCNSTCNDTREEELLTPSKTVEVRSEITRLMLPVDCRVRCMVRYRPNSPSQNGTTDILPICHYGTTRRLDTQICRWNASQYLDENQEIRTYVSTKQLFDRTACQMVRLGGLCGQQFRLGYHVTVSHPKLWNRRLVSYPNRMIRYIFSSLDDIRAGGQIRPSRGWQGVECPSVFRPYRSNWPTRHVSFWTSGLMPLRGEVGFGRPGAATNGKWEVAPTSVLKAVAFEEAQTLLSILGELQFAHARGWDNLDSGSNLYSLVYEVNGSPRKVRVTSLAPGTLPVEMVIVNESLNVGYAGSSLSYQLTLSLYQHWIQDSSVTGFCGFAFATQPHYLTNYDAPGMIGFIRLVLPHWD
ncbi:hypothetical protein GLOTRDRAFT_92267 [Gloeophyllum trabeum ATCC 11539]|uniref:Uncharacterized protein n=1 Tax=Gloeophyllum trabeum (strain ATCC 11539 / FP-39264 / Madison 617) TaxID=670483 RepID=S7QCK7_GLOTA|nr:uncharacterized protein GLOTRDRAFT_92267 [Gloeophyllum trabeum ATCC 11539]EPQ57128.1 hypothetical protein GLOTRDRAFT_92267 [Gloeophyllum trabeum ATCC 11539]